MAFFSVMMEFTFHRPVWFSLFSILLGLTCVSGVQFLLEPANVTKTYTYGSIVIGDSFLLFCQVDSLESNQKVSWYKNGEIISDGYDFRDNVKGLLVDVTGERYRLNSFGTSLQFTLQVRSVSPSTAEFDSGTYQCAATWWQNDAAVPGGRSRSAYVNIYVIPTSNYPVCKVFDSTDQEVNSNPIAVIVSSNSYTLTCLSSPSTPSVTLIWSRNDQAGPLPRSSHSENGVGLFYISHNWTPSRNDGLSSTFTCTLQHPGLSSDRTCSLNFNIQYAPIVTIDPTDVMVTGENDEIVLNCNHDSNPQVTETVWYYDDDAVNSDDRFRLEEMSLGILTFTSSENGVHTVTCELTNVIGTGSDIITLTVNIPTPSPKVTLRGPVQRTAVSGITVQDNNGRSTAATNKSHSTDPFAIPRKTNNTGIIIGSVVGVCLLIAVIIISVILICLKTRRKSSQSPKSSSDNFDTRRGESGGDVIGIVTEDTTSPRYETTNGAFRSEYSDIALELGGRAILKTGGNNKSAECDKNNRSDTVNSAELYSKPKKNPKPPKKQMDGESKTTESDTVHHSDTVNSADLYSKPKKKPKPPYKKKINQQKTGDEQYANIALKAKAKSEEPSVDPDTSPYANMSEKQNRATDSLYDSVNNSSSTDADVRRDYFGRHKQRRGDPEVSQADKLAFTKNSEGLTYAELDLSSTSVTSRPMKMPEAENTVYADLQL